jgi:hypothetical protein
MTEAILCSVLKLKTEPLLLRRFWRRCSCIILHIWSCKKDVTGNSEESLFFLQDSLIWDRVKSNNHIPLRKSSHRKSLATPYANFCFEYESSKKIDCMKRLETVDLHGVHISELTTPFFATERKVEGLYRQKRRWAMKEIFHKNAQNCNSTASFFNLLLLYVAIPS